MQFGIIEIIALAFYFVIAAICLCETFLENSRSRQRFDLWFFVGLLTSALWPLVLIVLMIKHIWQHRHQ
ncbi:hypothetical protein D3C87_1894470 [compost metagenome]